MKKLYSIFLFLGNLIIGAVLFTLLSRNPVNVGSYELIWFIGVWIVNMIFMAVDEETLTKINAILKKLNG